MADYSIQLGVIVDKTELNSVKSQINALTGNTHRIRIDIDNSRLLKQINHVKSELKGLNKLTNDSKGFSLFDTSNMGKSLNDIASTIKEIKASIGSLDSGAGMKSLVSSINQIGSALEKASGQFEGLNAELKAISSKDFSINLGINMGGSNNPIARNAAYGSKVRNETLPQLKKQAEALENYLKEYYKVADGFNAAQKLLQGTSAGNGKANLYDLLPKMLDNTGSLSSQMTAWKEYISLIKEAASLKNVDMSSVTSQFSQSAEKLVQDAQDIQSGAKDMENSFEKLKQVFGGSGGSIDAEGLSAQLNSIVADLGEIKSAVQSLSSNTSLDGLTSSFNGLSETLEKLNTNLTLVQNSLSTGFSGIANINTGTSAIDNIAKNSDTVTTAVIQNEKKKQEAYKATADAVVYHAGVVSKLNKAETNGRFYGSNRGTGYFGTGHYFVDSATKHELDDSYSYSKMPYTSVDLSKYDNLFRVASDEVGYALHSFLANLTRFTQGADDFSVDELFSQFKNVFGDAVMDVKEFGSIVDQLKTFMSKSDFYDRSDSVSTQFMKSLGYGGVDTRGTSLADTRYGTVIYDLKEESVLQANITDEIQKRGQMLEKINYEQGQVFDKEADDRILKELDEKAKRLEIAEEYERSFDETNYDKADKDLYGAKERIRKIDEEISYYQDRMENLDDAYDEYVRDSERSARELKNFGLDDDDLLDDDFLLYDEDEWKNLQTEILQDSINELSQEKAKLQSEMPSLEEAYNKELQLVQEAMEKAKQVVEQRRLEAQQAKETADVVVQGTEKQVQSMKQMTDIGQNETGLENVENDLQQVTNTAKNTADAFQYLQSTLSDPLKNRGFSDAHIKDVITDLQKLNLEISNVTTKDVKGGKFNVSVKGINELGEAVTVVRQYDKEVSKGTTIAQSFDTSADAAKRWKKEVSNAYQDAKKLKTEIGKLEVDLIGETDEKEISRITNRINTLKTELKGVMDVYGGSFTTRHNNLLKQLDDKIADNKLKAQNDVANKSETTEVERVFKRLKTLGKEIGNIEIEIAGLDTDKNIADINKLTAKLNELETEYDNLFNANEKKFTTNQIDSLTQDIADGSQKLESFKDKIASIRTEAAKSIKLDIEVGKFDNQIDDLESRLDRLSTEGTEEVRQSLEKVKNAYQEMQFAAGRGSKDVADEKWLAQSQEEYAVAVQRTTNLLKQQERVERELDRAQKLASDRESLSLDMQNWLKDNTKAAKKYGDAIRDLDVQLRKLEDDGSLRDGDVRAGRRQFNNWTKAAKNEGLTGLTWFDQVKTKFKEYASYFSVAEMFMYAEQAVTDMFEQVKLIDSAMTELKKVTDETDASYDQFLTNAASRAKEIGTTIDGLVSSTADFARLGYDFADSQGLAEVANIYAVVGDDIEGVEGATQSLISTMAAFKDEMNDMSDSDFAMSIVDKLNEVSNNFSISSGGLGEALQRSASSMAAANNTLDETIALTTAANEVVQNPEKVGNAMKTKFLNCLCVQKCA